MWGVVDKKWLKVVLVMVLIGVFVVGFLYFKRGVNAEKKALEQVIKRQEEQLKEKERKIEELQGQLEVLQKEQVLRERKVIELRKRRAEVKPPQSEGELIDRFKKLGYDVRVR
jgi:peptidoglycan hydrolase CwlO-like protein